MPLYKHYTIPKKLNSLKSETNVIGIDLGTSRCCAAVIRLNGVTTVPLDNTGERLLPSYVSYDEENAIFGKTAVKRLRNFSKSIVFDSKRIIGRNINDVEIDSNWPFRISENNGKVVLEIKRFNGGTTITAEEIATDLLKFIKEKSEEFQGTILNNVVITVPAAFTEAQKEATVHAAKLAGFGNVNLLPEPIAAAFAYFIDRHISNNAKVLLFDLGGGTLDVCIFKIQNDEIQIISNIGDTKLGGRDFDNVLFNHFKHQLDTKYYISLSKDKKYKLILDCQQIKEDLSPTTSSILNVDEYDPNRHEIIPIKREEFENLTKHLLNRIRNTLFSAVHDSKLKENEITKLLLVGGGSRMPMIKKLLKEMFPLAEHICEKHPDEVVAIGAAYYAYNIFPEMTTLKYEKDAILENSLKYNRESFIVGDIEYIQEKPKARERTATKQSSMNSNQKPPHLSHHQHYDNYQEQRYRTDTKQSGISQHHETSKTTHHFNPAKRQNYTPRGVVGHFVPSVDDSPIATVSHLADQYGGRSHANKSLFFPHKHEEAVEQKHHSRASSKRGSDASSVLSLKHVGNKNERSNTQHSILSQASISHGVHKRRASTDSVGTHHTAIVDKNPGKYDSVRVECSKL